MRHFEIGGLAVLAPRRQLDSQSWLELLEARYHLIAPVLPRMNLPQLGQTACLESEMSSFHRTELGFSAETTADDGLSLRTPGIFELQPWDAIEHITNSGYRAAPGGINRPNGTKHLWGLTDKGQWVVVTIRFTGHRGYKDRGQERAQSVTIKTVTPTQILELTQTPIERVWNSLGRHIEAFAEQQLQNYNYAQKLADVVSFESTLYDHHIPIRA